MSSRLRFESAAVGYPGVDVVSDATLDVVSGEVVGLIGPNGAGKSTLLRAVTGVARVTRGALLLGEKAIAAVGPRERARVVGVVPQAVTATFSFTALEFVLMGRNAHLSRLKRFSMGDVELAEEVMERTDTLRLADKPVDTLSGGDLQRLALAQALAQQPSVLLLDEATSNLDLNHRLQVLDLVRELADSGMAVLAVFHDLDLAARYSDRIGVVNDGRLDPVARPHEVLTVRLLADVFGVRAVVGTDPVTGSVSVTPVLREAAVRRVCSGRVLVIGGSGTAAPAIRALYLAGYDVRVGALSVGDVDHDVAAALGVPGVVLPAFGTIDAGVADLVSRDAREADAIVVCEMPIGRANVGNLVALEVAPERSIIVGGAAAERDYTGGEAVRLIRAALGRGARQAADLGAALELVADIIRSRVNRT